MLIYLQCSNCQKQFSKYASEYKKACKRGNVDFYCSFACTKLGKDIPCEICGSITYHTKKQLKRNKHCFCSRTCSNKFYSATKCTGQTKGANCKICDRLLVVSKQASIENVLCKECVTISRAKGRKAKTKNCTTCNAQFITKDGRYCPSCFKVKRTEAGLKSVLSQQRRSKNEIAFADLIAKHFDYELILNEPYFEDKRGTFWDADIIIPALKLAIHWNGPWHYKEISKKVSLATIQNRDVIKHTIVERNGFTNYIIRDDGAASDKKVSEEFDRFCVYLKSK